MGKKPPIALGPRFEAQLRSDLRWLQDSWQGDGFLDDDVLRRDSAILRRLLVDGGQGLLPAYRRELQRRGPIVVEAVDLKPALEGYNRQALTFASAGGATHNHVTVRSVLMYQDALTDAQIKERYERGSGAPSTTLMPITRYLDSTCMYVNGVSISRRTVIQFVANRLGGVHFDPTRDHSSAHIERQFEVLDRVMEEFSIADKNVVFFELLAIGQALVASAQVAEFLPTTP